MVFAEKYLGIKMNKRLSTMDSFKESMKFYIIKRLWKRLMNNISNYNIYGDYGKYLGKIDYKGEGIKDWTNYKPIIKKFLENNDNFSGNILIEEYKLRYPEKSSPKPVILPEKSSTKPVILSKPKTPPTPVLPKLKNPELKVNTNAYWGEITFDINTRDFDEINIKYLHNNKERKIINDDIDDIYDIKGLNPHCEYEFKVIGIINQISKEKIIKIKLDNKCKPEPPKFTVKDSTHDIEINFVNTIDHGLPIKNILLFKDNDTSAFERKPYNNQIKLDTKIHKRTKLIVKFENEFKCSEGTAQIIKNKECDREHFSEQVKKQSLEKTRHRCSKSNIYFDDKYFKCEFDHKDGQSCNNSIENCQPLLVEIHNLKTYHPNEFKKLDESDELFVYKYKRISGIFESLSNEDKQKILDTLKKENINKIN